MITPEWHPSDRQLRQFAVISLFGFACMGLASWRSSGSLWMASVLTAFGALICSVGLLRPRRVRPLYVVLLTISLPVGGVISGLLLRLIFYGVITPVGVLFHLVGRDVLVLRRPQARSYWVDYEAQDDPASYFRQS